MAVYGAYTVHLRNIIFRAQSDLRKASNPFCSFQGRLVPGSAASHNASALAFVSGSISA